MLDEDPSQATMKFSATLLPYEGDDGWVDDALRRIKKLLLQPNCPSHAKGCENGRFLDGVYEALNTSGSS